MIRAKWLKNPYGRENDDWRYEVFEKAKNNFENGDMSKQAYIVTIKWLENPHWTSSQVARRIRWRSFGNMVGRTFFEAVKEAVRFLAPIAPVDILDDYR